MDAQSISKTKLALPLAISTQLPFNPVHWMVGLLSLVCLVGSAQGQTSTTEWWNPTTWGSSEGSVRKSSYFSNSAKKSTDKPMLSLPNLPWSSDQKAATAPVKSSPSMFSKMGQSTKQAWNNTVDLMNPFEKKPVQPNQQGYQPQNTTKKKGSGMFGWMWREETTETPTSVNDFLSQERPKF